MLDKNFFFFIIACFGCMGSDHIFYSIFIVDLISSSITQCNSVRMQENTDQNNAEYGHFLRSEKDMSKMTTVRYIQM